LEDQRNVGESSCNSGDGTDHRLQSLMFMMMMMMMLMKTQIFCNVRPCGWQVVDQVSGQHVVPGSEFSMAALIEIKNCSYRIFRNVCDQLPLIVFVISSLSSTAINSKCPFIIFSFMPEILKVFS